MLFPPDPTPHRQRRERLSAQVGDQPVLLFAGSPVSRNYPAATYRFRAASHFLYFVGASIPGAAALLEGTELTVFAEPPAADDALWIGPSPTFLAIGERLGCRMRPLSELPSAVDGSEVATLPAPDLATRLSQEKLLGRPIAHPLSTVADAKLADAVIALRLVHDEAAIDGLRRAASASVAAHEAGRAAIRPGATEAQVRAAMEAELAARNMGTAYGSIVTVHGEVLHNEHYPNTLADGDLLLADVGAETEDGWAGDITRTWPASGELSTTQREIYQVVLEAQGRAIAAVKPGARYRDVHLTAASAIAEGLVALGILRGDPAELVSDGAHALFFPHGVGHLIGLDVHDMEDLGDRAGYAPGRTRSEQFGLMYLRLDRDLAPGMAVTIEPGFYQVEAILSDPELAKLAGDRLNRERLATFSDVRGIRIEDDVLVTSNGQEVLTAALPK